MEQELINSQGRRSLPSADINEGEYYPSLDTQNYSRKAKENIRSNLEETNGEDSQFNLSREVDTGSLSGKTTNEEIVVSITTPADIIKIADEIEKEGNLEIYWDYRDKLTDEQAIRIITEEDYLFEIENEIQENNLDYIDEKIENSIKDYELKREIYLSDETREELRFECEGRFKFNINNLIKNSNINIRVELLSNEDLIYYKGWEQTDTIRYFKQRFKGYFKIKDLKKEFNNLMNDYALITFYFNVRGVDILSLREQVLKREIKLRKGLEFGLFNSWIGGGSVLEIPLLKTITINLDDWRFKGDREEVISKLKNESGEGYYKARLIADNLNKYSIQETYGLGSWQKF